MKMNCLIRHLLIVPVVGLLAALSLSAAEKTAPVKKAAKPKAAAKAAAQKHAYPHAGEIERLDPAFDRLVSTNAVIELLAEGFEWAEGPVWVRSGEYLLFSDVPNNVVFKWKEGIGTREFLLPSGYTGATARGGEPGSNGLTLDPQGRLVLCEHGDRRVARLEKDGKKTTLANRYKFRRLNSPNDLVYKSNGDLYFTDQPYGFIGLTNETEEAEVFAQAKSRDEFLDKHPKKELVFSGVYRLSPKGDLTLLTAELTRPNGIALSPDEKTLYVANSDPKWAIWMAYVVKADGSIANGRVLFDATELAKKRKGLPDGMKVDKQGNLFATGPGGVLVISPAGKHLGTISPVAASAESTYDGTANCAWGNDGAVLYITADKYLCRVKTSTKGKVL